MSFVSSEEFTPQERQGLMGAILWPNWHYGVLLLYGQSIAMNHLIATRQLNIIRIPNQLDYPSFNGENVNKIIHIHVFHGNYMFSKFELKAGRYDNLNLEDYGIKIARDYALVMALEAKRKSEFDLAKMLKKQISKKS